MRVEGNKIVDIVTDDIIDGTFVLPEGVTIIGKCACTNLNELKSIPEGVISVENAAFERCRFLKKLPNSLKQVGNAAFFNCISIEKIPDSIEVVGNSAFESCNSLEEIPDSVKKIGNASFKDCASLKKISKNIQIAEKCAFKGCILLEEMPDSIMVAKEESFGECVRLKKLSNNLVTVEDNAFAECENIERMPDSIREIGESSFIRCVALQNISKNIKVIPSYAFLGCSSLKEIPDLVVEVEEKAFQGCRSLESMPDSIKSIGNGAFAYCSNLKHISTSTKTIGEYAFNKCIVLEEIPSSLEHIPDYAFQECIALKKIPDGVKTVGISAFQNCKSLERMPDSIVSAGKKAFGLCRRLKNISKNLKEIKELTFLGCDSLKEIPNTVIRVEDCAFEYCDGLRKIPNTIEYFGEQAFYFCKNLKTIEINYPEKIGKQAFCMSSITSIKTPYGTIHSDVVMSTREVIIQYLYLYANSVAKEKYRGIEDFLRTFEKYDLLFQNSEVIYQQDMIPKFQNLFFKMRKNWDIPTSLFEKMTLETTEKFQLKRWNEVKKIFDWENSEALTEALANIIGIFGIFENDPQAKQRIKALKELYELVIPERLYNYLSPTDQKCFEKEVILAYIIKDDVEIPKESQIYLEVEMIREQISRIKKLTGNYGKRINDFVKENYIQEEKIRYRLIDKNLKIQELLFKQDIPNQITERETHRIFDNCEKEFNEDFYQFLQLNLPFIIEKPALQTYVKTIQKSFSDIQKHYAYVSGSKEVSLKQAVDYILDNNFRYHSGNREMAEEVKNAGVTTQEAFDYYQEAFEQNKKRKRTSLIKRTNIYEIDGFKIKAELLRKDEIEAALVGEVNNTNCCQVYGGVGHNCMAHAVYSDDGGVFVTKLIEGDKEILLTQSWDWQNNNVYCHDNIESTPYLDSNKKLKKAVAQAFRLDGEYIIEKSQEEIGKYITERRKSIEKSLMSESEIESALAELKELEERQVIRVVTSGAGYDDLDLEQYFNASITVYDDIKIGEITYTLRHFQPIEYNGKQPYFDEKHSAYTDSKEKQYIIAGSLENLCLGKQEPLVPIYKDERRVVQEEKVRDYTFHKIQTIEKEAYPEEMYQYQNSGELNFIEGNSQIYLGEDWYLVYEERNAQTIYISDLARIDPTLQEESKEQLDEMNHAIQTLLEQYEVIEADLKEDTSYLLYLMNKKRGYIEQIGEDKQYFFDDEYQQTVTTEEEQQEILRNIKKIKENKNPENRMHHVTFKKGPRFEKEQNAKSK